MSGEAQLREELENYFDPYDWHDDYDGTPRAPDRFTVDEVIEILKRQELLITGGTILHVRSAKPVSGRFDDPEWKLRIGD